jgi:hypothetical protein
LQLALGGAEAEVSALQARVEEFKRRQEELARLVDESLQVESEMARLDRDYGVEKSNYDQLVSRRESLSLAEEANKSSDMFRFKVIEPPRVPLQPASPKRTLLNAGVLALGFGAGAALAWLLGMIRPAIYSREAFQQFTDLPVLGTVSRIMSSAQRRQHRLRVGLFAAGCAALVIGFGLTVTLEPQVMGVVAKLRDLGAQLT